MAGSFAAKALADAAIGGFTEGKSIEVTNDPNGLLNGVWAKRSGVWVQTSRYTIGGIASRTAALEARGPSLREANPNRQMPIFDRLGRTISWLDQRGWVFGGIAITGASRDSYRLGFFPDDNGRYPLWADRRSGVVGAYALEANYVALPQSPAARDATYRPFAFDDDGRAVLSYHYRSGKLLFDPDEVTRLRSIPPAPSFTADWVSSTFGFAEVYDLKRISATFAQCLSPVEGATRAYVLRTDMTAPVVAVEATTGRIELLVHQGQSLGDGGTSGESHGMVASPTPRQPYRGFKFNTDIKSPNPGLLDVDAVTGLLPASESFYSLRNDTQGTTMMDTIIAMGVQLGVPRRSFLYQTCAHGGRNIDQISKGAEGQTAYANTLLTAQAAMKMAALYGKGVAVRATGFTHGEADSGTIGYRVPYREKMRTLLDNNNVDIRAITGQAEPIVMIADQLSAPYGSTGASEIALAQLDAAEMYGDIFLSTPKYFFQGAYGMVSSRHLWPPGYALLGEYNGRVWHHLFQAQDGWKGLRPRERVRNGSQIDMRFWVPDPPLALDATTLAAAVNSGFVYTDPGGPSIASVAVVDNDVVRVTLTGDPWGATPKLSYAHTGGNAGNVGRSATWGNLRDSNTQESRAIPGLLMRNWALTFEKDV